MINKIIGLSFCFWLLIGCNQGTFVQGKDYYDFLCANCHMEDGTGLEKVIPSLVNSDYLKLNQKELPCLIRHGLEMPKDSMLFMPGNKKLTAFEISNIINYINTAWGNDEPVQNINAINAGLNTCL